MIEQSISTKLDQTHYETVVGLIEYPLLRLTGQLRERFEKGYYQLFIGDYDSGGFPTLVLEQFAQRLAERQDIPPPIVKRIRKHADPKTKLLQFRDLIRTIETQHITTSIIITEFISEGSTIRNIEKDLPSVGLVIDVASLDSPNGRGFSFRGNLYTGHDSTKNYRDILELRRFTRNILVRSPNGEWRFPETEEEQAQTQFSSALRDVNRLVDKLISTV